MLELDHSDPKADELAHLIQRGFAVRLAELLDDEPVLATAIVRDEKGAGRTLMHIATDWPGHFPKVGTVIRLLANAGTDINAGLRDSPVDACETPLHWAASSNDVEAIEALLDSGADIEAPGAIFTGGTAMSDAVVFAQWEAARLLLAHGAKTTMTQAGALGLVDRVAELCADPELTTTELNPALWHACRGGQQGAAELLLERGAELNWVGFLNWTPLEAAEDSGNAELVAALAAKGAKAAGEVEAG